MHEDMTDEEVEENSKMLNWEVLALDSFFIFKYGEKSSDVLLLLWK